MAYTYYDKAMYRTGFRPYGQTNPWAASQLNGMSIPEAALSGYLGQTRPFEAEGGWRLHGLGQNKPFAPWALHGLGSDVFVCGDRNENPVQCQDPSCFFGDCGQVTTGPLPSGICLDQKENAVMCGDPNCTIGDCIDLPPVTLPPGPANRVNVPPGGFTQTQQRTASTQPKQPASTMIKGVPDMAIIGFVGLAMLTLLQGGGRRR